MTKSIYNDVFKFLFEWLEENNYEILEYDDVNGWITLINDLSLDVLYPGEVRFQEWTIDVYSSYKDLKTLFLSDPEFFEKLNDLLSIWFNGDENR